MIDDPERWNDAFNGLRIEVSLFLEGCKTAVQEGDGPIMVSPAMFDLIRNANERELEHLLRNIKVLRLPKFDPFAIEPVYRPLGRDSIFGYNSEPTK